MRNRIPRKIATASCAALVGSALLFGGTAIAPTLQSEGQAGGSVGIERAYAASKVYIAPHSGTKYHKSKRCRGLRRARGVKKISVKKAKRLHYKMCKVCW